MITRYQSYILEPKSKYLSQTVKGEYISMGAFFVRKSTLRTKQLLRDTPMSIDESFLAHERIRPYILGRDSFFIDIGVPECYKKAQKLIPNFIKDAMQ